MDHRRNRLCSRGHHSSGRMDRRPGNSSCIPRRRLNCKGRIRDIAGRTRCSNTPNCKDHRQGRPDRKARSGSCCCTARNPLRRPDCSPPSSIRRCTGRRHSSDRNWSLNSSGRRATHRSSDRRRNCCKPGCRGHRRMPGYTPDRHKSRCRDRCRRSLGRRARCCTPGCRGRRRRPDCIRQCRNRGRTRRRRTRRGSQDRRSSRCRRSRSQKRMGLFRTGLGDARLELRMGRR